MPGMDPLSFIFIHTQSIASSIRILFRQSNGITSLQTCVFTATRRRSVEAWIIHAHTSACTLSWPGSNCRAQNMGKAQELKTQHEPILGQHSIETAAGIVISWVTGMDGY